MHSVYKGDAEEDVWTIEKVTEKDRKSLHY
jgi:hypothetical protein